MTATGTGAVLSVEGPLTFATAAETLSRLQSRLAEAPVQVIDLAGVSECDSAGLACVLALMSDAQQRSSAEVQLAHVPAGLRALAEVAGLARIFG
ncbi:STAS domain-containing protein [Frateuria aurantia]